MSLKWKGFEHRVVQRLRDLGFLAERTTSGRQGQGSIGDILADRGELSLMVECKSTSDKKYAASRPVKLEWLRKLEEQAVEAGRIPVLVFNFPNRGYYAVLRLEDLVSVKLL